MNKRKRIWKLSTLGLLSAFACNAFAAGYKMEFQSASVLADAGEAAVVEDAGTNWYNSAGLVYLPRQVVISAIDVYAPVTISGTVNAPSTLNQLGFPINTFASNFTANGSGSSHSNTVLPAYHLSFPVSERIALGLSIVPAWGFKENYGETSILRYNLTEVTTKTIDIAPSIAFKFNDRWSVGAGPDINYFAARSQVSVRTQGTAAPFIGTVADSYSRFSVDDWNYGGHIGVLYRPSETTRVGFNYRSKIVTHLSGDSDFVVNQGGFYETNNFQLPITLPPTSTLSLYHDMTPCWALMGTIAYDEWSTIKNYHARNYAQPPTPTNPSTVLADVNAPAHMRNTIDLSAGTHFKLSDTWMLRGSLKYEPTPTNDAYRSINFPDGAKLGINVGTRYQVSHQVAVDLIYGHVFVRSENINDVNPATHAVLVGHTKASVDVFGGQLVWNI